MINTHCMPAKHGPIPGTEATGTAAQTGECGLPIASAGAMQPLGTGHSRWTGKEFWADSFSSLSPSCGSKPQSEAPEKEGAKVEYFEEGTR